MAVTDADISLTYSGGGTNNDPDASLGGDPSVQPIFAKRLFDDVSEEETMSGIEDYRCFYLHNENAVDTLYDAEVSVLYTQAGNVTVQLGFDFTNERQVITITNATSITGGSFDLEYEDLYAVNTITVNWDMSLSTWATNLETELRTITNLETVTVSASYSDTSVVFEIDFVGVAGYRYHEILRLASGGNNLTATETVSIGIVKTVEGGPINKIADEIDVETTAPHDIVFSGSTIVIGDLRPLDSVPIWAKRMVPADTPPLENDGFTFKIKGSAVL